MDKAAKTTTVVPGVYLMERPGCRPQWIVQWTENGKRRTTTTDLHPMRQGRKFKSAAQAIRFREWVTDRERLEAVADPKRTSQPFGEYVTGWFDLKCREGLADGTLRPSTVAQQRHMVQRIMDGRLGGVAIGAITADMVTGFKIDLLEEGLANSTVRQVLILVRAALEHAADDDLIRRNPAARVKLPEPGKVAADRRTISEADVERLAEVLGGQYGNMVRLAARTGLRFGEVAALTADDITVGGLALDDAIREHGADMLGAGELHVRRTLSELAGTIRAADGSLRFGDPKTDSSARVLPIPASVVVMLAGHVGKFGLGEERIIFANRKGLGVQGSTFRRPWRRAVAELGLGRLKFHGLRHQTRTWLQAERYGLEVVAVILGHAESSVTQGYGQVPAEVVAEALGKLADRLDRAAGIGGLHTESHTDPAEGAEVLAA